MSPSNLGSRILSCRTVTPPSLVQKMQNYLTNAEIKQNLGIRGGGGVPYIYIEGGSAWGLSFSDSWELSFSDSWGLSFSDSWVLSFPLKTQKKQKYKIKARDLLDLLGCVFLFCFFG